MLEDDAKLVGEYDHVDLGTEIALVVVDLEGEWHVCFKTGLTSGFEWLFGLLGSRCVVTMVATISKRRII